MDYLDYRTALGISFDNDDLADLFIKRIEVFIKANANLSFTEQDESNFAYTIGSTYLLAEYRPIETIFDTPQKGLIRVWLYLSERTECFKDFLACLVAFANLYSGNKSEKKKIWEGIKKALDDTHITYELLEDTDGKFIFPKGANELDNSLISQPLQWMKDYPSSRIAFSKALKEYAEGDMQKASDIADKLRKSLETFFQEFFGGGKSLENYKSDYGVYLKQQGVPKEISGNFETLLNSYTNFMNNYAKHHDKTTPNVLEYLLYQTGNIIRLLIVLKKQES